MENEVKEVLEAWNVWLGSEGIWNNEYDALSEAMERLQLAYTSMTSQDSNSNYHLPG